MSEQSATRPQTKVAIIGAGNVGGNLGIRLSSVGVPVCFGVRSPGDTQAVITRTGGRAQAASIEQAAAFGDVVFLAVPGSVALEVARGLGRALDGKIVVDCNNPVGRSADGPVHAPPPEGSLAAAIARAVPGARVVKAFNTFGAEFHLDPQLGDQAVDVQMASDDAAAKQVLADLARRAGFVPVDVGPLRNAALLENLAVLWIHLAMRGGQGRQVAFKLLRRG